MGLGPSIKMTTLYHYNCPLTKRLMQDTDIDFAGIILNGVSERYLDKIFSAKRTGTMVEALKADGAIIAIDGWGNHHVDFTSVIEQIQSKGIATVGLSYIGQQGRLVCNADNLGTIVDFNKCESGYESCVVGQNYLSEVDAVKAVEILKCKMRKTPNGHEEQKPTKVIHRLIRRNIAVAKASFGNQTAITGGELILRQGLEKEILPRFDRIQDITVRMIAPEDKKCFVNSNLDFMPIVCKAEGELGEGVSHRLTGITVMLTGVEDKTGFQPANIGSSEGYLIRCVEFDTPGTPSKKDFLLHIDCLLKEGEGRTAEGIIQAHEAADYILREIRNAMADVSKLPFGREELCDSIRLGKKRVVLVKIVSGLGNMYDTAVFPDQPAGILGAVQMRNVKNLPILITGNQCLDGAIHSLL